MSNIAQHAREEAERTEQEEAAEPAVVPASEPEHETPADAPEPDDDEAAAATPPPEHLSDAEIQKRFDKAGKEGEKYLARVRTILGPTLMADLLPSPLDTIPGLVLTAQGEIVDAEAVDATKSALGLNAGPDYQPHPERRTCQLCDGWGDVRSGAKRPGNELLQCPNCGGLGYTDAEGRSVTGGAAVPAAVTNGATVPQADQPYAPSDPRVDALRAAGYTVLEPIHVGP